MKNISAILALAILLMAGLACSESGASGSNGETQTKSVPPSYLGVWNGADGSSVTIRNDATGDYKSGGKSVSGAAVEIDEAAKEIRFAFLGFDSGKYKIDQSPTGNRMKLDGMEYQRTDGSSSSDSENKPDTTKRGDISSGDELGPIVAATIRDFDNALQQGDFDDFYSTISETWQSQIAAAELQKAFSPIAEQRSNYKLKPDAVPSLSSKPTPGDDDTLEVNGTYPTIKGKTVAFKATYVKEGSNWKLLGIRLNP
ncbi:MAG: hypothetical protein WKF34_02970 [Pyrinomonadaceae bacterium]